MKDKHFGEKLHPVQSKAYDKWVATAGDNPLIMANVGFETFLAGWQAHEATKRESVNFVEALENAQKIVEAYPLYKKFIDGTPLSNDMAALMAEFAVKGGRP